MKNRNILYIACFVLLLVLAMCHVAYADEITPYADSEFSSATTTLKTDKSISFRAVTYDVKEEISVTAVWLERKNADGSWTYICALTPPSTVFTDTFAYSVTVDYSASIGSGTYRAWATYNADGHAIVRSSNERTY